MKRAMLVTVGVGPTVSDGIAFSIRQAWPDFVLFLTTVESEVKTLAEVLKKTGLEEGAYECWPTSDENDIERCALDYAKAVRRLIRKGYDRRDIVADFTSGTKAMSAGLVAAGLEADIEMLSYVYGERDAGRVVSGTERLMALSPTRLMSRRDFRKAVELFNDLRYDACLEVLEDVSGRTDLPELQAHAGLLRGLAEAYRAWDRFDYGLAMERLDGLTGNSLLPPWGLKRLLERHKVFLYRVMDERFLLERAVDLWNSAERRAGEGRFDDAVARLYRLLEYVAQVQLYQEYGGLETGKLEVEKLPERLQESYGRHRGRVGQVELGLVEAYALLRDLGDQVGKQFMEDFEGSGEAKAVLGLRNNSVLAHGFGPVNREGFDRAAGLVRRYLDGAFKGWEKMAKDAVFPRLKAGDVLQ